MTARNIKKTTICLPLLAILLLCFQPNPSSAQSHTLVITPPPAGEDATPTVREALEYTASHHITKISFPKARYDFYPDRAAEKYIFTANNDESLKRIVFLLSQFHGLEIDGQGASFVFHGFVSPFVIENSDHIRLKNFSIDWDRTFHSEGRILSVTDSSMDLLFPADYPYKIEDGRLVFYDTAGTEYPYSNMLEFDSKKYETAFMAEDHYYNGYRHAREIKPGRVRLLMTGLKGISGNTMVFNAAGRLCSAITASDSRNLSFDSLHIYHAGGMGIVAQRCRDIHIDHSAVTRNPEKDRVLSIIADATHFINCSGRLLIENSIFQNQMDDATNIHGVYVQVTKKPSPQQLEVGLRQSQQLGFDFIKPGMRMELTRNTTLEPYDTLTVRSVKKINKEYTLVGFTKPLPGNITIGKDILAAIDNYPEVTIRGCTIQKNRARGLLLGSRGKILLEDNYFHTPGAAILFEGDGSYWFEQSGVRNVTIRDNHFDNCNYGVWGTAAIQVGSGIGEAYRAQSRYNRNITITGNTFTVFDPRLVSAYSVQNLVFSGNKIIESHDYPNNYPNAKAFDISNSSGISVP